MHLPADPNRMLWSQTCVHMLLVHTHYNTLSLMVFNCAILGKHAGVVAASTTRMYYATALAYGGATPDPDMGTDAPRQRLRPPVLPATLYFEPQKLCFCVVHSCKTLFGCKLLTGHQLPDWCEQQKASPMLLHHAPVWRNVFTQSTSHDTTTLQRLYLPCGSFSTTG